MSHYLSAWGLSWDSMLKIKKAELELITDPHMYIFFDKVTTGGIYHIFNRYSKAEIKYVTS